MSDAAPEGIDQVVFEKVMERHRDDLKRADDIEAAGGIRPLVGPIGLVYFLRPYSSRWINNVRKTIQCPDKL